MIYIKVAKDLIMGDGFVEFETQYLNPNNNTVSIIVTILVLIFCIPLLIVIIVVYIKHLHSINKKNPQDLESAKDVAGATND